MTADVIARIQERTREDFAVAWERATTPRPKRKPSVWAEQSRIMPPGGPIRPRGGPYDLSATPHCVEPMNAADDEGVRYIVLWWAIREAKTSIFLNILGRTMEDCPCGIFSVHPTDSDSEKFVASDLDPMLTGTPSLNRIIVQKKSRDAGNTKEFKKYSGGDIRIFSAGSLTKFRGSTVGLLGLHELDALEKESIYKAIGRTTGIADAVILLESSGTLAPTEDADGKLIYNSAINEWYDKGDKRKWFCQCKHCAALNVVYYRDFAYPSGEMAKTEYVCPRCANAQIERDWRRMSAGGIWYPTAALSTEDLQDIEHTHHKAKAKQPEVRSYWRNGFTSLLPKSKGYATKLHQFVAEGEAAKASPEALKTWTNEVAAELWSPQGQGEAPPDWQAIFDRREDYGLTVPIGGLFLSAFVDVQKNRLEVSWKATGRREESWGMDHRVIPGYVADPEVWQGLRRELGRKFQHELGCDIALGLAFIDGGRYGDEVYKFLSEMARNPEPGVYGKVFATKGYGPGAIVGRRMVTVDKRLKGFPIGTWRAKSIVTERLRMVPEENDLREGLMHFNLQFSEEYIQQMCREVPKVVWEKGAELVKWENPNQRRNEGLDLEVGNLAAVRFHIQPWDMLEADLKAQAERAKNSALPQQPEPRARRRSSFVSDWR